jgi:hypothetical protein
MTMNALRRFAKEIAGLGLNTLVMEWEATFPFKKHATLCNRYAYTPQEVRSFIKYCVSLGIDVIPLQQCFGHSEYILQHDRYFHLSENSIDICQVCPCKKTEARKIFTGIFKEIASMHPSKYMHIGCDETWILGSCPRCSAYTRKHGKSRLFVEYVKMICRIVRKLGKRPVLWADMLLHHPEAVSHLPKDTILVDWNYGWEINRFGNVKNLIKKGCTFWGSPSLRSGPDNFFLTKWNKHLENIRDFIPFARRAGYQGMVMTSWSTSGRYGYEWDQGFEVVQMYTISHRYPLSGFRMLVTAFAEALKNPAAINPKSFVMQYTVERFGFSKKTAMKFWNILGSYSTHVESKRTPGGKRPLTLLREAVRAGRILKGIKPLRNRREFDHFVLMLDLRINYLSFKVLEDRYQSPACRAAQVPALRRKLKKVIAEAPSLDKRYLSLNKDYLYTPELKNENQIRNKKMKLLYKRMAGVR